MDSRKVLVVCVVAAFVQVPGSSGSSWGYFGNDNEAYWGDVDAKCTGSQQSPINIDTNSAIIGDLPDFKMSGFNSTSDLSLKLVNNGHTVKLSVGSGKVKISGGGLRGDYTVAQLHFHWGNTTDVGSEHTVDGAQYPMEMHVVTYKASYGDIGSALEHSDGLAVIGYFFQQDDSLPSPPGLTNIMNALPNINTANSEYSVPAFNLDTLIPTDFTEFYRYFGSLTTPTCNEVVTWTVVSDLLSITQAQLEAFRNLEASETNDEFNTKMYNNFRSVQALNGRSVLFRTSAGYRTSINLPLFLIPIMAMALNKLY